LFATVAGVMRFPHRRQLGACMGAPGPHDLTVRDKAPLVSQRHPVHRIPPRVRDDASAPHIEAGWADHTRTHASEKQKYFCARGLTRFLGRALVGQITTRKRRGSIE
jgi:hypothetical protein